KNPRDPAWYIPRPGIYEGSVAQIDLLEAYYRRNIEKIIESTGLPMQVALSQTDMIPVQFAFNASAEEFAARLDAAHRDLLSSFFHVPDPREINDDILHGKHIHAARGHFPLMPFTAVRIDEAVAQLPHYLGSGAEHIQSTVIFGNYPMF